MTLTFRQKMRIHGEVHKAIAEGLLVHPSKLQCAVCGAHHGTPGVSPDARAAGRKVRIGYHHWNYDAPLWVTPLCGSCHTKIHWRTLPDPSTGELFPEVRIPWQQQDRELPAA